MKKRSRPLLTAGISSLLLIFVSLCLLTFAVLSLVSARADYRLSTRIADRTTAYYAASNQAHDLLQEVDAALSLLYESSEDQETYFSRLSEALPEFTVSEKEVSFSVSVNEEQLLSICLEIQYPASVEDSFYRIHQWQTVNLGDWIPDTKQNLYIQPES